jgi:histidinol-phosphatase
VTETHDLLTAAVEIVTAAGALAARRFAEGSPETRKADGSPVTAADAEVEQLIRDLIAARFPGDAVRGEELGEQPGTTGRRWVIDPIDGTTYFTLRIPLFEILLAVEDEAGTAAGVASVPMAGEMFYAGRGLGCWRQVTGQPPERVRVSDTQRLRGAAVSVANPCTWPTSLLTALHEQVLMFPNFKGTHGVASGVTDAAVIAGLPMDYHDLGPMPVMLAEAGGRVTDLAGNDVLTGNGTVLASNGHLHDALLDLVRDLPTVRDYEALRRGEG